MSLTSEEAAWFAERAGESASGKILITDYMVKKYRKLSGDTTSSNSSIRNHIINECNRYDML